jgi:hypothetical protein
VVCANEAHGSCQVKAAVRATSSPAGTLAAPSILNSTAASVTFQFPHAATAVVDVWAEDAMGNICEPVVLLWRVDTQPPRTVWPPLPPLVNFSSPLMSFNCTKDIGCTFMYALGAESLKPLGNASLASNASAVSSELDTRVLVAPRMATRSPNATFVFHAVGAPAGLTVETKLDGAVGWVAVGPNTPFTVVGLTEGVHTMEARARCE